jgi:N-acetylmuramoyl-L-alanine amidase CwlA
MMVKLLPINPFSRSGERLESVEGIVWHWTGNAGKGVSHTVRYFEILGKQDPGLLKGFYASAHFIIDKDEWAQVIPIYEVAYHSGSTWWNKHSIGIEICHPKWDGEFKFKTLQHLYDLTAFLMGITGLEGKEKISRHYDITGKLCPKWFVEHPDDYEFAREETERRRYETDQRDDSMGDIERLSE